jgi:hypothetical protein
VPADIAAYIPLVGQIPALALHFDTDFGWVSGAPATIASTLTVTGGVSTGSLYTKADGTLVSFANNVLRYGTNGLLVEEARTNLAQQSQTLSAAFYATSEATVGVDATAAPDGTTTADAIVESTNAGNHIFQVANNITISNSTAYTLSFYAKANGRSYLRVFIDGGSGNLGGASAVDLVGAGSITAGSGVTKKITQLANGWYRVELTATSGGTTALPYIALRRTSGTGADSYTGDGASGVYLWGMQLEAGAFATSYIPTTSASVARAVEIPTFADLSWFDGTAVSIYAEWVAKNVANATVFALDAANDVTLNEQSGMSPKLFDAGATFAITTGNTAAAGATVKAAMRMATNDIALCMNGGTVGTDTSATQPGTLAAARLGVDLSGANSLNTYLRRFAVFKGNLLSNSALQSLTT